MNKEVALVLLSRLESAYYLDRTSGLVQVISKRVPVSEDGPLIEKRIPYAHDATIADTATMAQAMIPNSKYKSCLYFEDGGISSPTRVTKGFSFQSRLRLVCWLNMDMISGAYLTRDVARIEADIIHRVAKDSFYHDDLFTNLRAQVSGIAKQDRAIFSQYDYAETETQFLMPPFDFFAIDFAVSFTIMDCATKPIQNA